MRFSLGRNTPVYISLFVSPPQMLDQACGRHSDRVFCYQLFCRSSGSADSLKTAQAPSEGFFFFFFLGHEVLSEEGTSFFLSWTSPCIVQCPPLLSREDFPSGFYPPYLGHRVVGRHVFSGAVPTIML